MAKKAIEEITEEVAPEVTAEVAEEVVEAPVAEIVEVAEEVTEELTPKEKLIHYAGELIGLFDRAKDKLAALPVEAKAVAALHYAEVAENDSDMQEFAFRIQTLHQRLDEFSGTIDVLQGEFQN